MINDFILESVHFQTFQYVAGGVWKTLQYTFLSAFFGAVLGFILALCKMSRFWLARQSAHFYTSVFRGTPMLVQLSIIYFGVPSLLQYQITPLMAGVIAFSLNCRAFVSEAMRSGIQGIDLGQFEAAQALNIPYLAMMKDIILPQAIRNVLPALVNEAINLLKETALISTLGEEDIMRRAHLVASETYSYLEPLMMAAVCYYFLVLLLSTFARKCEKWLSYDSH